MWFKELHCKLKDGNYRKVSTKRVYNNCTGYIHVLGVKKKRERLDSKEEMGKGRCAGVGSESRKDEESERDEVESRICRRNFI